jgi:hypothetical protein
MAGLLMKELIARSDLRTLPRSSRRAAWLSSGRTNSARSFNLEFDILSRDMIENSRHGQSVQRPGSADRPPRRAGAQ